MGVSEPAQRCRACALMVIGALVLVVTLVGACGRSGYQYVESDNETVFLKIPEDWSVVAEGSVNYSIVPEGNPQLLPGEFLVPWRAVFNAAPKLTQSTEHVAGFVEMQPVDRRMRASLNLLMLFPYDFSEANEGIEVVSHDVVSRGDVSGHRISWRHTVGPGQELIADQLVMADDLNSVVYTVGLGCSVGCYMANSASIDEIMRTVTVRD